MPLAGLLRIRLGAATLVTTNLVPAEPHALIMRRIRAGGGPRVSVGRRAAPNVVVYSTSELEATAEREWLARFTGQALSLADAVSSSVMSDRGIREALTLDDHFTAAGFTAPP